MTLPFENDTTAIIKKLADKSLKADKTRNVLFVVTIALAACLILATTLYFFGTQRSSRKEAAGMYQANISDLEAETAHTIAKDRRVTAGFTYLAGYLDYGEYKAAVRTLDENLILLAKYPAVEGTLPEKINEIAATQAFLDREGLSSKVGDTISLDLADGRKDYKLSGVLPVSDSNYSIFVSPAYIEKNYENPLYLAYINVLGTDGLPEDDIQEQILGLAEEWGIEKKDVQFSTYYFSLVHNGSSQYLSVILIVIFIVTLACALVIYSLLFVSIIRKTNEYGKLRTIGTTSRQVRQIVIREGRRLCAIGIPAGILLGAGAGYVLAPKGWHLTVTLLAAAFTAAILYFCIMFTIRRPAHMASKVPPIEAVRYIVGNEELLIKSTKNRNRSLSVCRLALLNFTRNKKKTGLTIASLGICGILLMASSAYFNSISPADMARQSFPYGDVRIELGDYGSQSHNFQQFYDLQKKNPLSPQLIQQAAAIEGVKDVREYRGAVLNTSIPTGYEDSYLADAYPKERQALLEEYLIEGTADLQKLVQNNGIVIKQLRQWEDVYGWKVSLGDQVILESGSGSRVETRVMGIVDENIPYGGYELIFIPMETLSALMPVENMNYQLVIDTDAGKGNQVRTEIKKLLPINTPVYITTLNTWVETYEVILAKYRMPIYVFLMFIGVFGIINLLNTLITNVLARRREFGILRAVGMSSRQISRMLLAESMLYTLGVLVISVSLGAVTGAAVCKVFSSMSIFGEVTYHFPIWEMSGFFFLMLLVQIVFSIVMMRQLKCQSLTEQIRELA